MQVFADFFHWCFQLGIIESHELTLSLAFETRIFLPKNAPIHPIQPYLKELTRKISYNNLSVKLLFWIPNLDVFQLFHCKICHNSWQPLLKPNICAELSSQNRQGYFEIGNVNKPQKYRCRKTVVMSQIQIECKIIHCSLKQINSGCALVDGWMHW